MNQRGFATLEVILMVMVIGILASIAVPRFTSVTTAANTAKIQSDLATINTAIAVYQLEHGKYPDAAENIDALSEYIQGAKNLNPPSGYAYIKEGNNEPTATSISGKYKIVAVSSSTTGSNNSNSTVEVEAALGSNTADKFYIPKKDS